MALSGVAFIGTVGKKNDNLAELINIGEEGRGEETAEASSGDDDTGEIERCDLFQT